MQRADRITQGHLDRFGAALRRRREEEGISLRRLAALAAYSPGWLSKVENGLARPTLQLAEACDRVLDARGDLTALARVTLAGVTWTFPPAQLPPGDGTPFVGRTAELRTLDRILDGTDTDTTAPLTAVVEGAPGTGKTALALRWAHTARERFPDGILHADLLGHAPDAAPADPARILAGFLIAFGVPAASLPAEPAQLAAVFRSLVAGRRVLVVLDDAADARQVLALLPTAPGSAAIVTSRRRLTGLGAARLHLGPLAPADSIALLQAVVGKARVGAEPASARFLAYACGHLPLALRIAAGRLAAGPHRMLRTLAADLADPTGRLDALADGDDRRNAVRPAFDTSYRRLDAEAALLFRLLGGEPRTEITVLDAARLTHHPAAHVRRTLETLADRHLIVESGPDRYRLEGLLRLYATERGARARLALDAARLARA